MARNLFDAAHGFYIEFLRRELDGCVAGVYAGKLYVFGDGVGFDFAVLCHGVHLDFFSMLYKLGYDHRMLFRHVCRKFEESLEFVVVRAYVHSGAGEHVRRSDEHGIAHFADKFFDVGHRCQFAPARLVDAESVEHRREFVAIFGVVDAFRRCSEDVHSGCVEARCQVVGDLSAGGEYYAVGRFEVDDVHHALVGQLVEVETVAHVVVGRHGLGVVVYHHAAPAFALDGHKRVDATPVELYAAADAVCAGAEHNDRASVALVVDVVFATVVGQVEVVGLCGILGAEGVDLFHHRGYAEAFAQVAHFEQRGVVHTAFEHGARYLEVGEALLFRCAYQFCGQVVQVAVVFESTRCGEQVVESVEEPAVDFRQLVHFLYVIAFAECRFDNEDALVGRLFERLVDVADVDGFVFDKSVHALPNHAQTFLDGFFEGAADCHDFADGFHRRADFFLHAVEFAKVPARYLADYVVEGGLEECRRYFSYGVFEVEQSVAESEFGGYERQGIACGFGGKGATSAQSGVDFDDAVVHRLRVVGILHVAFADDADVADYLDGEAAQ